MHSLIDPHLFVIEPSLWNTDREKCLLAIDHMYMHFQWMKQYGIVLPWCTKFLDLYGTNKLPNELNQFITAFLSFTFAWILRN